MPRHQFKHNSQTVYEWQQSLNSLTIFIKAPQLPKQQKINKIINVNITPTFLEVGIKGNPPYLKNQLQGIVVHEQSLWYIQQQKQKQKQICIQLQKAQKGIQWGCAFKGHKKLNQFQEEQLKKKLLLERFGQQNPTFDFSQAQFNGQVPEARNFMGGVKYQ